MLPEIVIGPILVVAGVSVILLRRRVVDVVHRGLEKMYGEPVAGALAGA